MSSSGSLPPNVLSDIFYINNAPPKGRAVYAKHDIPQGALVEISPVLIFSPDEYQTHGKYTVLDQYTYKFRDGRMALALGFGSLFNHADPPNLRYTIDFSTESIRYETTRRIHKDEELTIWYGPPHSLWFDIPGSSHHYDLDSDYDDHWGGLSILDASASESETVPDVHISEVQNNPVPVEDLPFRKVSLDREKSLDGDTLTTMQAWVADIPDPRQLSTLLKWITTIDQDLSQLAHLKRVRKQGTTTTLLLSASTDEPHLLPPGISSLEVRKIDVPSRPAITLEQAREFSSIWPTVYTPRREVDTEIWPKDKVRWAWRAMRNAVEEALRVRALGELTIGAHVPIPFGNEEQLTVPFTSHDTRSATQHPLKHAVINLIRKIADHRATSAQDEVVVENGAHYLLTSLSLFITHEPCIMCSMALLHSRVKEVFYLIPMAKTGGCGGGITCLPNLEGVNHRFAIYQWSGDDANGFSIDGIQIDSNVDV